MRLLLVEDDHPLGQALAEGLRQRGHVVDWFTHGADADRALEAAQFDVIVLDLGLPGGDGLMWLSRWRAARVDMPVVILTARDDVSDRIAGLDGGADEYLVKPITIDELAARLRALARRSAGQVEPVWRHGALEYDPSNKQVRWQGERVELTGRELGLLDILLSNPRRVLSRQQLQEKLYDWSGNDPESNVIEVLIHHLRRKISPDIVRNIRGVGYSIGSGEPS